MEQTTTTRTEAQPARAAERVQRSGVPASAQRVASAGPPVPPAGRVYDEAAQKAARRRLVQRAAETRAFASDPGQVHEAARAGLRASAGPLPFGGVIQRAFGRHGVDGVRAHRGPLASAGAAAMGAAAYTQGEHVVLGGGTDLRTVAHEAAHVVQQRVGVTVPGGVGRVGDPYERHAEAVAQRVVSGDSAEDLLDRTPAGAPAAGTPPVQRAMGLELEFPINVDGLGVLTEEQQALLAQPLADSEPRQSLQQGAILDKDLTLDTGEGFKITPDHNSRLAPLAAATPAQIPYPNVLEFSYQPPLENSLVSDGVLDAIYDRVEQIQAATGNFSRRAQLAGQYYVGPVNTEGASAEGMSPRAYSLQTNIGIETTRIPDAFKAYAASTELSQRPEGEDEVNEERGRFQTYLNEAADISVVVEASMRELVGAGEPLLGLRGLFAIMALYSLAGTGGEPRGTVKNFTPLLLKTPISALAARSLTPEELALYNEHKEAFLAAILQHTRGDAATLDDLLVAGKKGERAGATVRDLITDDFKAPFVVAGKTIDAQPVGPFRGGRGDPRVRGPQGRRRGAVFETRLSRGNFTRAGAKRRAKEMYFNVEILHMVDDQDLLTEQGVSERVQEELGYTDRFRG